MSVVAALGLAVAQPAEPAQASSDYEQVVDITFPIPRGVDVHYRDDYHDPRTSTRMHQATDLMVALGTPVHAVRGGTVSWVSGDSSGPPSYGWMINVRGDDGRTYAYIHLGTQDGPRSKAYAPGIEPGATVQRGQLLGWAGCSGSATCGGGEHLHIEIHDDNVIDPYSYHDHERINPYWSLLAAEKRNDYPGSVTSTSAGDRTMSNGRTVLRGDWDGDGDQTPGWWDPHTATFHLKNTHGTGNADMVIPLGRRGDRAITGDWDGDGTDEIGIRRGNTFHLAKDNTTGTTLRSFSFGSTKDRILAGDWDGNRTDTIAVIRNIDGKVTWFLTNKQTPDAHAEISFTWGSRSDLFLTGDWNNDGIDGPAAIRDNQWFLNNNFDGGRSADITFRYGRADDVVTTGDWNGNGTETVAVVRGLDWYLTDKLTGGHATTVYTFNP